MSKKTTFVSCREFSVGYEPARDSYPIDSKFQAFGEKPLVLGQRVTLAVGRRKGRKKLLKCIVDACVSACTCGSCDYTQVYVAVRPNALAAHQQREAKKLSFKEWMEQQ